ncbi:MAG: replicative DNA helicase [Anaerolineales bacterium]|nr:replicative DNA helicase [Anaerolineales bacterium]MCB9127232.1 replicative DNA helicase [Ardenticatenales bacterium]
MSSPLVRPPLYNLDAEEATLGSIFVDPDSIAKVTPFLTPDDFYREKHRWIFEAMLTLHRRSEPMDALLISDELERMGRLSDVGGIAALAELTHRMPTALHIESYGRTVERHALLRRLVGAAENIAKLAYEEQERDVAEIIERAERELFAVSQHRLSGAMVPLREILSDFYELVEALSEEWRPVGVQTGFESLDKILGGMQTGDLIILAARPSVGKTAFALSIAQYTALHGARVAYFSLEMGVEQIAQRLVSMQTGIDAQRLRIGPIYTEDLENVSHAIEVLGNTIFFVDETPAINPLEMRTKLRRVVSEYGIDLVVVDYLQLMASGRSSENRVQEVSYISRMLKEMARELKVPVLALSQLSRGVDSRQEKRPMLSDLRDSGSIEQDADVVMFIYRDEVYNKDTERPNLAEIIVAKHRNGPTGVVDLRFTKENAKFTDLEAYFPPDEDDYYPIVPPIEPPHDDIIF